MTYAPCECAKWQMHEEIGMIRITTYYDANSGKPAEVVPIFGNKSFGITVIHYCPWCGKNLEVGE